jgi:hypothetical protein
MIYFKQTTKNPFNHTFISLLLFVLVNKENPLIFHHAENITLLYELTAGKVCFFI